MELPPQDRFADRERADAALELELAAFREGLREIERSLEMLRAQFERIAAAIQPKAPDRVPQPSISEPPDGSAAPEIVDLEKALSDAKRYARLLVSEIELYNPGEVARGRQNKDLYARLRFHIERSRQAYEAKFGNILGGHPDYFSEEIVRALAQSDPALLGPDYPFPHPSQ